MKAHYEIRVTDLATNEVVSITKRDTDWQGRYHYEDQCEHTKVGQRVDLVEVLGYEVVTTLRTYTKE